MNSNFNDFELFAVPERHEFISRGQGANEKGLILSWEAEENSEKMEAFLGKILSALQLNLERDAFLLRLTPGAKLSFAGLREKQEIQHLVAFGIPPTRLGLHFEFSPYQAFQNEQITFLFADSLPEIYQERQEGGRQKSGALWNALQTIFLKK